MKILKRMNASIFNEVVLFLCKFELKIDLGFSISALTKLL